MRDAADALDLRPPQFARLADYFGMWLMEPSAFRAHWEFARTVDWKAHAEAGPPAPQSATTLVTPRSGGTVAVIDILGTLMKQRSSMGGTSTIQLRREIRQAAANPEVSAILLAVESPGGTVSGTSDLADEVRNAGKQKPVWAHVDDLMASAAYWVGSQTDRITANSNTALVGSIGTLLTIYDASQSFEREGIRARVFSTGPIKGAGIMGTALTDDHARYFQGIVDGMQADFDAAVRRGRKLSAAQLADVKTGGVWKAPEAQERKLIDGIQPLSKTIEELGRAARTNGVNAYSLPRPGGAA